MSASSKTRTQGQMRLAEAPCPVLTRFDLDLTWDIGSLDFFPFGDVRVAHSAEQRTRKIETVVLSRICLSRLARKPHRCGVNRCKKLERRVLAKTWKDTLSLTGFTPNLKPHKVGVLRFGPQPAWLSRGRGTPMQNTGHALLCTLLEFVRQPG